MASITRYKNRWRALVQRRVNGQRKNKSKIFDTKREAQAWANRIELQIGVMQAGNAASITLFKDVCERYLLEVSQPEQHSKFERRSLSNWSKSDMGKLPLTALTSDWFSNWKRDRLKEVAASTVNRELNIFSAVFTRCVKEWQLLDENPILSVSRPKNPKHRTRRPTLAELDALALHSGWALDIKTKTALTVGYFMLAIETGMRRGELLQISPDTVFIDDRYIQLETTKNGDSRRVPLTDEALPVLDKVLSYLPDYKPAADSMDALFRKVKLKAGINDLHFHDSRHEAASRLAGRMNATDLALWFGWKDLKYALVYYQATPAEMLARLRDA